MSVNPKTVPCWWCGNPDTRVGYGMQPVGIRQPPGARVECWGEPDEVCGTCSPYVWRNGRDISEAASEAVKRHNAGPRREAAWSQRSVTGETSDGHHTFNELYAHRGALWKAVCRLSGGAWRSKKHSDGSEVPGWFVLGMGREPGSQCTYHLPAAEWDACSFAETLDTAPTFDGHTPADVLARLDGLKPPTREDVERAVDKFEAAVFVRSEYNRAHDAYASSRDALVKLATRRST